MFSGVRPQSFNEDTDWEVVWKDLGGSSGNLDWEKREIQLDNISGKDYRVVLQELGEAGLYQGGFTMQSANVGTFLDIDRQAPKVLFNSEITSTVVPSDRYYIIKWLNQIGIRTQEVLKQEILIRIKK